MEGYTAGNDVWECSGAFRNKKARTGRASWGVSSHVGTCGNWYLVEPGGFEPPSASTPLSVLHA